MDFLKNLNSQQEEAVKAEFGQVLVLAGPGSGKTRVLTHRIAYLIAEKNVDPKNILAVTFTNKAARVMESRVYELLGGEQRGIMLGTFHSVCARILRREAQHIGVTQNFSIYDEDDQLDLVKQAMSECEIDEKIYRPGAILNVISRAKNDMITAKELEIKTDWDKVVQPVFQRYQELLLACNSLDFDDLLLDTAHVLEQVSSVREYYANRFEHILVDEFQDTNLAQYTLLKHLASVHRNLFVVGDEDQSIYRWRGADYKNVMRFEKDYPDHQKIVLEQNYRSSQSILDVAVGVITPNKNRTPKHLFTEHGKGEPIILFEAANEIAEAEYVVQTISAEVKNKRSSYSDFAVMYRSNSHSRLMETAFLSKGIPYRLVGAQKFYGRREVKDCIAYLRLVHNPKDAMSLERIINVPSRTIGDKTIQSLRDYASSLDKSSTDIIQDLAQGEDSHHWKQFRGGAAHKLADFGSHLNEWLSLKESLPLPILFNRILEDINYRHYVEDGTVEGIERWENVEELCS